MTRLSMKRIEIAALQKDRKKIVELLQRRGMIEFDDCSDEAFVKLNTSTSVSQFEKNMLSAVQAKEILDEYAPEKKSLLASLNGRREIVKDDFGRYVEQKFNYLEECYELIRLKKTVQDDQASMVRTQAGIDALQIWMGLEIPMQFAGTKHTRFFIGSLPRQWTQSGLLDAIARENPELDALDITIVSSHKEQTCIAAVCHREAADETLEALRKLDFTFPSDPTKHPPKHRMQRLEDEMTRCRREIEECIRKIRSLGNKRGEIEFLIDYLTMRRDKYIALSKVGLTEKTFVVSGYIPGKHAPGCIRELEERFPVAVTLSTPSEEEDVPVLLENNGFASPVEGITEMYSLPGKKDIDPSPVMAFFYYLFFGMMLSDAGYGVLMVVFTAIALKKFSVEGPLRKTLKMFLFCGISTVFWGAAFGSWFGDIVPIVSEQFFHVRAPSLALWFEPIKDPMKLLLFSFGLGIIHLFVGLGVSFKMSWADGNKLDAFLDTIPTALLILGAAPLAAGILAPVPAVLSTIGQYAALAGMILIVLTAGRSSKNIFARLGSGVYGLYNIASGYLSDVLSYSRLLALGLATGSIAGVINLMGTMPKNPALKLILLVIVFLIGHPLNMAINMLGAYVHSNRLQFVELFSKFYKGGGRPFNPLKVNTKYIKFKEDGING